MEWSDLRVLLAVSRGETLRSAAQRASVNPTTIARRVDALEDALGVQLVERRRDGVRVTEAGQLAVRMAEQMETLAHELERMLIGSSAALAGSLCVTCADMLAAQHAELFTSFVAEFPEIELEVLTGYSERSLSRREADIALRMTPRPDESLFGRKLTRFEYALYGERALVTSVGRRSALAKFPWVSWSTSSGARLTEAWMKKNVPDAKITCRFDSALALHAAVREGAGVAFLACAQGDGDEALVRVRPPEPSLGYDLWVLTHPDLARTARVRAFLQHAAEFFDARRSHFSGTRRRK